jgi:hypothetical protein
VPHKPLFTGCPSCPETRRPALVFWQERWVCANCRHVAQGNATGRRGRIGRCAVCWRDGLPLQRHHPGRALWYPALTFPVCRSCHLVLSVRQKERGRWDVREPFHALQDRLGADHGWRELAQGTWEMFCVWADSRPLFAPEWAPQEGDDFVLIPLGTREEERAPCQ